MALNSTNTSIMPRALKPVVLAALVVLVTAAMVVAVVRGRGDDPTVLRKQAEGELASNRAKLAEATLARLARLGPPTPADRLLRARAARADGRMDDALKELSGARAGDALEVEAKLLEGQIEVRRDHLQAAEIALSRVAALDPNHIQARRELIYIYGMQLRREALGEQFRALSRMMPLQFDQVWLWSMSSDLIWWEPSENARQLERVLAIEPGDAWARRALADNLRRLGRREDADRVLAGSAPDDHEARAMRAQLALDRGDEASAASLLGDGPDDHPALARLRGRLALSKRDAAGAVRALTVAYNAQPWRQGTAADLGRACRMAGDKAASDAYLDAARRLEQLSSLLQRAANKQERDDPNLRRDLGAACLAVGRRDEARAWYRLAIDRDPLDPEAQRALHRIDSETVQGAPESVPKP